ncbi:MAG: maleylpyruvate isomerase family mycothiol-dependent enzyme [Acidimicrobiales bacterium]
MDRVQYLQALARDGEAFASLAADADLTVAVPACPGWTLADLVYHLGEVHHFWRTIVGDRRDSWDGYEQPERPADADLVAWYRAGLAELVAVLTAADPAQANWTWSSDKTAGFVIRRMAQETAIHRWDAEQAAGLDTGVEPHLASDGIDEFLMWFADEPREGAPAPGGSVHLHCGDVPGEWTVRLNDEGTYDIERAHAKGDCALRGSASDLLLALWRRRGIDTIDVVGDAEVAARFVAYPALE